MAKLLIIGASRGIGRETVKAALAAGHSVRPGAFGLDYTHSKSGAGEGARERTR